jgi:hypothetical protein
MEIETVHGTTLSTLDAPDEVTRPARAGPAVSLVVRIPHGTQRIVNYRPSG